MHNKQDCFTSRYTRQSLWLKLSHHLQLRKPNFCKILQGRKMRISPLTIIPYPQPIPPLQSLLTHHHWISNWNPTESTPSPMTQSVPHISFKDAHLQDMVMDLEISLSVPVEDLELTYNDSITSIDTNLSMQGARKNLCPIVSLSVTNHCLHSL